jgi:hypothetical protein
MWCASRSCLLLQELLLLLAQDGVGTGSSNAAPRRLLLLAL